MTQDRAVIIISFIYDTILYDVYELELSDFLR